MATDSDPSLSLECALLGFLQRRPMHAYEMHQLIVQENALGRVWYLKQSHLYALLARLEHAGYIDTTTEPQGVRPPRKVMSLTPRGHAAFIQWLGEPVAHGRDFRLEFLAKLYFASENGPARVAQLVARQRCACAGWLTSLHASLDAIDSDRTFDRLVLQFRISQITAILAWLSTCETALLTTETPSPAC